MEIYLLNTDEDSIIISTVFYNLEFEIDKNAIINEESDYEKIEVSKEVYDDYLIKSSEIKENEYLVYNNETKVITIQNKFNV